MCFQKAAAVHIQIYRLINCKKQHASSWCLEQEAGTGNIFTTVWENAEPGVFDSRVKMMVCDWTHTPTLTCFHVCTVHYSQPSVSDRHLKRKQWAAAVQRQVTADSYHSQSKCRLLGSCGYCHVFRHSNIKGYRTRLPSGAYCRHSPAIV